MKDNLNLENIPSANEAKRSDSRQTNKTPMAFTIIFWTLVGALVLYFLFMLLVPPMPIMNLRMLLVPNYTIVMYQDTHSGTIKQSNMSDLHKQTSLRISRVRQSKL